MGALLVVLGLVLSDGKWLPGRFSESPVSNSSSSVEDRGNVAIADSDEPTSEATLISSTSPSPPERQKQHLLDQLEDPLQRSALRSKLAPRLETQMFPVSKHLNLSADEHARLTALLVEQALRSREKAVRCELQSGCDSSLLELSDRDSNQMELEQVLGAERARRFSDYMRSLPERQLVGNLRLRLLDGGDLTSDQEERLIMALADEREAFLARAKNLNLEVRTFVSVSGEVYGAASVGTSAREHEFLESAREYTQRVRNRAAEVLSPTQLDQFSTLQQSILESATPQ
jgi:hypothetical protein